MNEPKSEAKGFPEQLLSSRVVGELPAEAVPWMNQSEPDRQLNVTEAVFADGSIYIASAIPPKLASLSEEVRGKDNHTSPDGRYSRLDEFMLQAAHLEANGQAGQSDRIHLLRGGRAGNFQGLTIKSFGESPRPNTRRMYYAQTRLATFCGGSATSEKAFRAGVSSGEIDPNKQLLIRLGYADKQNQLEFLHYLTGRSHKNLRKGGAGAI